MIGRLGKVFFITLLIATNVAAQHKGFSSFSGMSEHFPCSRFLKIAKKSENPAMVVLYGTFGESFHCINRFLATFKDRKHVIEVHFSNESCRKFGRCKQGEFFGRDSVKTYNARLIRNKDGVRKKIHIRTEQILLGIRPNKNTRLLLSTGLEDRLYVRAWKNLYASIKDIWPYEIIRAPEGNHPQYHRGAGIELHGPDADYRERKCTVWNQDGFESGLSETARLFSRYSHCGVLFSWTARAQGIHDNRRFIEPLDRDFKISREDILIYGNLLK